MATDFYKLNGSYYNVGDNSKIANTDALKVAAKTGKEVAAPTSALKPVSVAATSTANKATGQTTKGYDANGNVVYVKPGEYNPGISLTNPKTMAKDGLAASAISNSSQDEKMKEYMQNNGELPTVKNTLASDQANVDQFGAAMGYDSNIKNEKPTSISMADEFTKAQKTYGTEALETSLTDLQKEQKDIEAAGRARKDYAASKPVAMGVISGKQSEIDKQQAELLDANLRKQDYITNQLKNKYATIQTVMNLKETDYENATKDYNAQFAQNMQVMNYMQGVSKEVDTKANQVRDDARANLTLMTNAITSGGMTWADLPEASKTQVTKYEVAAGLPIGFTQALQNKNPKADILSTTTRTDPSGNSYADIVLRDANGKLTVQSQLLGKVKVASSGSTGLSQAEKDERQIVADFKKASADWITKLAEKDSKDDDKGRSQLVNKYDWATAYDSMKTQFGDNFSSAEIDAALGGGYDQANGEWYGRAKR